MTEPTTPPNQEQTKPSFWQRETVKNVLWLIAIVGVYFIARSFMQGDVARGPAPDFKAVTITGQEINLADYRGQPVLVHFWATWCPICELEIDGIESVARDYAVINIATQSGPKADVIKYADEHRMNKEIIVNDPNGVLMKLFNAHATPTSFMIDKEGVIQYVEVGYSTSVGLKGRLWSLK